MKKFAFYLLPVLFLLGCVNDSILRSTYEFPENQWKRFDNPELSINIDAPGMYYNMFVELEYLASQPPQEFTITVIMYAPSGEMRARDLLLKPYSGADQKSDGHIRLPLRKDYAFSDIGPCKFEIENRSSRITTNGIKNISIVLEKIQ